MKTVSTRDRILARFGLMPAMTPIGGGRAPDMVVRPTVSRETGASLGILHEARCKHCDWAILDPPDTLSSCLERGRKHLRTEHGIRIDRLRDVKLGSEQW